MSRSRLTAWNSAHVIAAIVVGFLTLVAFVLWDAYGHRGDPLLPLHLFKTRGYLAMVITAMGKQVRSDSFRDPGANGEQSAHVSTIP